jgi:phage shock protein E
MRLFLLPAAACALALACQKPAPAAAPAAPPAAAPTAPAAKAPSPISGADARALVARGAQLVDVRSAEEFAEEHVEGARNLPVDELDAKLGTLSKDKPVVVYCASGARSEAAARILARAGFDARDLGGMSNWKR